MQPRTQYQSRIDQLTLWQLQQIASLLNTDNLSEAFRGAVDVAISADDKVLNHVSTLEAGRERRHKPVKFGVMVDEDVQRQLNALCATKFDGNLSITLRYVIKKAYAAMVAEAAR